MARESGGEIRYVKTGKTEVDFMVELAGVRILLEVEDMLLHQPHPFSVRELVDEPDRCAFRIVREVYQAFGYTEDKIPAEFDRETGRLELGD